MSGWEMLVHFFKVYHMNTFLSSQLWLTIFFILIAYFKITLLLFDKCLPHSESTLFSVILLFCVGTVKYCVMNSIL